MNSRDSEFVAGILIDNGFALVDAIDKADIILFNSCSVRKHAEDRLFSNIAELRKLKERKKGLVIGLIGCTAQRFQAKAVERMPLIDIVCGPGNEAELPALIKDFLEHRCTLVAADKVNAPRPELFPGFRHGAFKANVSIGEGCNNFCSYCIVPYVRGRERSRDPEAIIKEAGDLAARGFKEITLLGQNVNSYGRRTGGKRSGGTGFVRLLERLNAIKGIERIRFMTSHPKDASVELFKAMGRLDKVCGHLHLPLQSGSDRILRLMNRGYTSAHYRKLVRDFRKHVPGASLTTDIIVGFPTEKDADFKKSLGLMEFAGFDSAYVFKYSPRPPAKSASRRDDVPDEVKDARLATILRLQSEVSRRRNETQAGKTVEVLVDGCSDASALSGRTGTNKVVVFEGPKSLAGRLVAIRIESVTPYTLKGRIA